MTDADISAEQALSRAIELHESGSFAQAEALYAEVLDGRPDDPDALHLMGLLLHQRGNSARGAALIGRALELLPDFPVAQNNLGMVLRDSGRNAEAAEAFAEAVKLKPDYALAYQNLGAALKELGRTGEAITAVEAALRLEPDSAAGHFLLGDLRLRLGQADAAIAAFHKGAELDSDNFTSQLKLIRALDALKRPDEAQAAVRQWLARRPDDPFAQHMAASLLGEAVPARASDGYVRRLFDSTADSFDAHLAKLDYRAPDLMLRAFKAAAGAPAADLDIIDAGCGTGLCGPLLRPFARNLIGVDLSPAMLSLARDKGSYDELVEAELTAFLEASPQSHDAIISADTFCYFGDLSPVMGAAATALRPGGRLLFTVEAAQAAETGFVLNQHGRYGHAESYIRETLAIAGLTLRHIGFERLRYEMRRPVAGLVLVAQKAEAPRQARSPRRT